MSGVSDFMDQVQSFDLAELDFERIGVWPLAGRIFVAMICVALVFGITYYMFISDLKISLENEISEEATLKASFESKAFQSANLVAYRRQMQEMEDSFGALLKQLPSDTEVPGLLEDIDEKGSESGLAISKIELQEEKSEEFYVELPISITVHGGYHDLGGFVSGVAGMPRIVTLHDYDINSGERGELTMNIVAKTYRYKSQDD
ncbi:type 4a pilus biogenesis protein PilO [Pseudoteredinibacter isoporae]|uniref:Type IV pilus assembly protein PilO n=1 Tax=Pseudoteredinibacter isoporae TaxID=570281 RepID=A0A7X0JR19_9GAMM|nr:type 4a pilus biogenesis protein PilO [Pseudoteredinibacter isoporae]MBB6519801.1 type IV pilus assembly protein PilO [Pseudoteredinibacter isoporae]NHO85382.1 type 4a pilus biogenesis protein PilO [Pseudoteredinibacter isoporae]NIB26166.1 type 4a pilus biogenesis protein PilO [Pseudoteredinibacter isoporae]